MKTTDTMILFWGSIYSQWYEASFFDQDAILYNCNEQYMMAQKALLFDDRIAYDAIMQARSPKDQKALGRKVGTNAGAKPFVPAEWDKICRLVVRRANLFKFLQNPGLKSQLMETGYKLIVEASPWDKIWGCGLREDDPRAQDQNQWQGTNWLGLEIMAVRKLLTESNMTK